jgi:hypothetical protein
MKVVECYSYVISNFLFKVLQCSGVTVSQYLMVIKNYGITLLVTEWLQCYTSVLLKECSVAGFWYYSSAVSFVIFFFYNDTATPLKGRRRT